MSSRVTSKSPYITTARVSGETGRRRGDDDGEEHDHQDRPAPPARQERVGQDAEAGQQNEQDRELEHDPEGEQEGRHEADVVGRVEQRLDGRQEKSSRKDHAPG